MTNFAIERNDRIKDAQEYLKSININEKVKNIYQDIDPNTFKPIFIIKTDKNEYIYDVEKEMDNLYK